MNTIGGPQNPLQNQYSSIESLLRQSQNLNQEKPIVFTTTPNIVATEPQNLEERYKMEHQDRKGKGILVPSHPY